MSAVMSQKPAADKFLTQVARSFGEACDSYVSAARLQQRVALDALSLLPADKQGHLLDLGCGPGWIHPRLLNYCQQFTAADMSAGMLAKAAMAQLACRYIQADAQQLPLPSASVDTVFSSLMLQWCNNPAAVFSEVARILTPGGRVVLTTLIDGTLSELKQAFATLDSHQHVNSFLPAAELQTSAAKTRDIHWQFEPRCYRLHYSNVQSLARELKALGANQVAGRQSSGLTGKGYWQKLAAAYDSFQTTSGLPATYQVMVISGVKQRA